MALKDYTDEELEAELNRRKPQPKPPFPKEKEVHDFSTLRALVRSYLTELNEKGWADEDSQQYIFEAAIELFFDKTEVWEFIKRARN